MDIFLKSENDRHKIPSLSSNHRKKRIKVMWNYSTDSAHPIRNCPISPESNTSNHIHAPLSWYWRLYLPNCDLPRHMWVILLDWNKCANWVIKVLKKGDFFQLMHLSVSGDSWGISHFEYQVGFDVSI